MRANITPQIAICPLYYNRWHSVLCALLGILAKLGRGRRMDIYRRERGTQEEGEGRKRRRGGREGEKEGESAWNIFVTFAK